MQQLIIYLDISPNSVRPFITDVYVNQSSLPMEFITNEYSVTITVPVVFRRYTNTKFSEAKTSLRTNHGKQQGFGNSVEIESTV